MESSGVFFLGLIAVSSLAQTVFLVRLAFEGRRVARRVDEIQSRMDRDIRPAIDNLNRFSQNLGEVSELVLQQVRRIDAVVADTAAKIQETTAALHSSAVQPLAPLMDMAAFFQGLRRGYAVYRQLRGFEHSPHGNGRNYPAPEDEHMFI